jgi:hypothetical protein
MADMTMLALLFLWLAVAFAILFFATFSDGEGDIMDEEPTLNTRSDKGD